MKDESSLVITTPPLEDGTYTVTSKVLSKIDGHLVRAAIIFGVGEAQADVSLLETQEESETTFLPEAAARFPGIVGQTVILGSTISAIAIWGTQRKHFGKENLILINQTYRSKFSKITGAALVGVLVSNFVMLAVQTVRLETSPIDVIGTSFGTTWLITNDHNHHSSWYLVLDGKKATFNKQKTCTNACCITGTNIYNNYVWAWYSI